MENSISIRPIVDLSEFEAVERLQRIVWGVDEENAIVASHLLITAQHHGGVLLGAFEPGEEMVGFVFGFIGTTDHADQLGVLAVPYIHCSHMLAVLPEYRKQDVARALKLAQREAVLAQGLRLAVWTYDPLLSVNAWMNITRLGTICRTYIPNLYGELAEALNAGLPTDRFEVEWWLDSPRVQRCTENAGARFDASAWRKAGAVTINGDGPKSWMRPTQKGLLLVEIPADFQALKEADFTLALQWRLHIREIFEWAFNDSYTVVAVARDVTAETARTFYVLSPAHWTEHLK